MDDRSRRAYRMLANLFLAVGAGFLLAAGVQAVTGRRWFQGNPVPVAALLLVVGGLLLWTARSAPRREPPSDPERRPPEGLPPEAWPPPDASEPGPEEEPDAPHTR